MAIDVLDEARNYLAVFVEDKTREVATKHPWRNGAEFAVLHSLRVESYVSKILARWPHNLSEDELLVLRLAAILHDIGRMGNREHHAAAGRTIVQAWLQARPEIRQEIPDVERLLAVMADHSNKGQTEPDFMKAVLKDADTLDEIGVMSVFMTANWLDRQSPFFFYQLHQRLVEFEMPFCEKKFAILNTPGARDILLEKKKFIEAFIVQLADELDTGKHAERLFAVQLNRE